MISWFKGIILKINRIFSLRFGAKDAKAKHAVKEKQYELLLDDEIEFIQVIFIATFDVTNNKLC